MSLKDLFRKPKYVTVQPGATTAPTTPKPKPKQAADVPSQKRDIPEGLWVKCAHCSEIMYNKELDKNIKVCGKCGYHFRMPARDRIDSIVDEGTFVEYDAEMTSANPLDFPGYEGKLAAAQEATGLKEAVIVGKGQIGGNPVIIGAMDARYIMASMGSVVGEKITRAIEVGIAEKLPVVLFCASGGARMQEGIVSLMQMAKTSAALARLSDAGLLYVSVLTDPTTGGVTASFASLGDVIIAEPGTLIGFAGPRVIEQTIRQKLPDNFQKAEFMMEHGFVDMVVPRTEMKNTLANLLSLHGKGGETIGE